MAYLGDFPASATVYVTFDSFAAATGAPSATTNFAAGDIQIYKDGSTTQRSSSAGITVTTSFDSNTGLQMIAIDTSDNTDAGFYAAGHEYNVAVADITVDGQTLRFWADSFSIERTNGALARAKDIQARLPAALTGAGNIKADVLAWLGTTVSTPTVGGVPNVNAKTWNDLVTVALPLVPTTAGRTLDVSAGGEGGLDWANVGSPTTAVDLSGTTIKTTQKVDVETIKTNPVVNGGTITFPTNKTLADTTSAVGSVTGNVGGNVTGSVGSVVGNVGGNVTGSVGSIATGGISSASFAAAAIDAAAIAADAIGSSEIAATAATEIANAVAALAMTEPTTIPAVNDTLIKAISWLLVLSRNKITQTATTQIVKADDGSTTIASSTLSDDGTTFTRNEFA